MNNRQNRAGQSTREMAAKRHKNRIWFLILTLVIVLVITLVAMNPRFVTVGSLGSLGLLVLARLFLNYSDARDKRMLKEEKRAIRGATGEEKVGSILESLSENYVVTHDVVSPYGNIDHVVISKNGGIFLLETKAHGGRVSVNNGNLLVNGHDPEKDFISQALNNTYWLKEKVNSAAGIQAWVIPVVVFTNAFVERTAPIKGVAIINHKFLLTFMQRSTTKAQNLVIWENREKIFRVLRG